ncbi:threonine ammonia-lyase IlvA [Zhengella sp. ZM62]|uniref:threonine ammonia-lyase IlvA n=1 Tax=Zhengella sedimenti TaxID=3390035 RepID=UPI003976B3E9
MSGFTKSVETTARALRDLFAVTPLQRNDYLSRKYHADIWLKREDLTPVRSYKLRGAYNFMRKSVDRGGDRIFVCASAGNHAQGFAFTCRHFGRKGVVFMPVTTPQQKIDKTVAFGGRHVEIRLVGDIFDACYKAAIAYAKAEGGELVPPFDHKDIIEGQATVALEIGEQLPPGVAADLCLLPVGGGGLSSGVIRYWREAGGAPRFVLCEPAGAPSLKRSLEAGRRIRLDQVDNFVDGAAVAEIGAEPFRHLEALSAGDVLLMPENRLCSTIIDMLNVEGIVLEPAGALAVDALKDIPAADLRGKTVVCVTSGGNFDFERLPDVKERSLRFEGLKKYFIFRFPQRPGALRDFLDLLGPQDDIVRFEYLKKSARNFGSVLIGIETRDPRNFPRLKKRFDKEGWGYQDITENEILANLII